MDNSKLVKNTLINISPKSRQTGEIERISSKKGKQSKDTPVSKDDKPERLRGIRPEGLNPVFHLIDNLPPGFDPKEFKRLWEACIPKSSNIKGIPMIFGTGGEQQIGEKNFYKQMFTMDKY